MVVLGILLSAVQWVPSKELLERSLGRLRFSVRDDVSEGEDDRRVPRDRCTQSIQPTFDHDAFGSGKAGSGAARTASCTSSGNMLRPRK